MQGVVVHGSETRSIDDYFVECKKVSFGTEGKSLWVHSYGDQAKLPIVFVHDVGLNHDSCFRGFLNHLVGPDARLPLFEHFSVLGVDLPGCHPDDQETAGNMGQVTLEGIAADIEQMLREMGVGNSAFALGVGAGATIITIQALLFPLRYQGTILIAPSGSKSTWGEYGSFQPTLLALRAANPTTLVKDAHASALAGLAGTVVHYSPHYSSSDSRHCLESRLGGGRCGPALSLVTAMLQRPDLIGEGIRAAGERVARAGMMRPRVLVIAGEDGYYFPDTVALYAAFPSESKAWVKLKEVGGHAHEESPGDLLQPIQLFFNGFGFE